MKPLHINKGKTIAQTITDRTDYAENPDKTRRGELVTGYECVPRFADSEFLLAKQLYLDQTGRDQGDRNILAYHIRQAFKPGEITPELANEIGRELAMRFTKNSLCLNQQGFVHRNVNHFVQFRVLFISRQREQNAINAATTGFFGGAKFCS
jgi:hypothetical protein